MSRLRERERLRGHDRYSTCGNRARRAGRQAVTTALAAQPHQNAASRREPELRRSGRCSNKSARRRSTGAARTARCRRPRSPPSATSRDRSARSSVAAFGDRWNGTFEVDDAKRENPFGSRRASLGIEVAACRRAPGTPARRRRSASAAPPGYDSATHDAITDDAPPGAEDDAAGWIRRSAATAQPPPADLLDAPLIAAGRPWRRRECSTWRRRNAANPRPARTARFFSSRTRVP